MPETQNTKPGSPPAEMSLPAQQIEAASVHSVVAHPPKKQFTALAWTLLVFLIAILVINSVFVGGLFGLFAY